MSERVYAKVESGVCTLKVWLTDEQLSDREDRDLLVLAGPHHVEGRSVAEVRQELDAEASLDGRAARAISAQDRFLFEVHFDQENRVRALESKAPITRTQYRDALIALWKTLNT